MSAVPKLDSISEDTAAHFFKTLIKESVEYRDIIRSCEDRTQYISLMLEKSGIASAKVWIIAPARYTLLSRELITVSDPFGVFGQVTWGYHVAPIIEVKLNGKAKIWVIDQLFSPNSYLTLEEWLMKLNSPNSIYFFTGVNDYLFNSLNGLTIYDNVTGKNNPSVTLPSWMPNILSGHFQAYDYDKRGDDVATGIALNDLAMKFLYEYIPNAHTTAERNRLVSIIMSEDQLERFVTSQTEPDITKDVVSAAKEYYLEQTRQWKRRLEALSRKQ